MIKFLDKISVYHRLFLQMTTACLVLTLASLALAQVNFEDDYEDENKPWQEIALQIPAPPQADNLQSFYVSPTATQKFLIDIKSISVGTDEVVRYTLVSLSSQGAKNISYEGIRCATFEKKIYAIGHPDGTWSRSRRNKWEPIIRGNANRQHAALARDYFCSNLVVSGTQQQIVRRVKDKRSLIEELNRD